MAQPPARPLTRRGLLRAASALLGVAAGSLLVRAHVARAAKAPKNAVGYQDQPKGDAQCSRCRYFEPGDSADAAGTCQLVAGDIASEGWCTLFAES